MLRKKLLLIILLIVVDLPVNSYGCEENNIIIRHINNHYRLYMLILT